MAPMIIESIAMQQTLVLLQVNMLLKIFAFSTRVYVEFSDLVDTMWLGYGKCKIYGICTVSILVKSLSEKRHVKLQSFRNFSQLWPVFRKFIQNGKN